MVLRMLNWLILTLFVKDVAEFERKELIKVRIHHALRTVSTALTALTIVAVSMSIIDIELHYLARGKMIPLQKLRRVFKLMIWAHHLIGWFWKPLQKLWNCLSLHMESSGGKTKLFIANSKTFPRIVLLLSYAEHRTLSGPCISSVTRFQTSRVLYTLFSELPSYCFITHIGDGIINLVVHWTK